MSVEREPYSKRNDFKISGIFLFYFSSVLFSTKPFQLHYLSRGFYCTILHGCQSDCCVKSLADSKTGEKHFALKTSATKFDTDTWFLISASENFVGSVERRHARLRAIRPLW